MRKPTVQQIKNALEGSACLLGQRICPTIEDLGFQATPNKQYNEDETGKSKEIDVHAIKSTPLSEDKTSDVFETVLVIKCENNSSPMVFFTQEGSPAEVSSGTGLAGYPGGISKGVRKEVVVPVEEYFNFGQFHHSYKAKWAARQFCELKQGAGGAKGSKNKLDWCVSHENQFQTIENLLDAAAHFTSEIRGRDVIDKVAGDAVHLRIVCPILLFSGPVFECRIKGKGYNVSEKEHLTFRKRVKTETLDGTYNIDVVQEDFLSKFLRMVSREDSSIVKLFEGKYDLLKLSSEREFGELEDKKKESGAMYSVKWT